MQPDNVALNAHVRAEITPETSPVTVDSAEYLRGEADRICSHLRNKGNAYTVAVFVTPKGVRFASPAGRRAYGNLVAEYSSFEIGHYNRRVDERDLLDDLLHAVRELG